MVPRPFAEAVVLQRVKAERQLGFGSYQARAQRFFEMPVSLPKKFFARLKGAHCQWIAVILPAVASRAKAIAAAEFSTQPAPPIPNIPVSNGLRGLVSQSKT